MRESFSGRSQMGRGWYYLQVCILLRLRMSIQQSKAIVRVGLVGCVLTGKAFVHSWSVSLSMRALTCTCA